MKIGVNRQTVKLTRGPLVYFVHLAGQHGEVVAGAGLEVHGHLGNSAACAVRKSIVIVEEGFKGDRAARTTHTIDVNTKAQHEGSVAWVVEVGAERGEGRLGGV